MVKLAAKLTIREKIVIIPFSNPLQTYYDLYILCLQFATCRISFVFNMIIFHCRGEGNFTNIILVEKLYFLMKCYYVLFIH